MKPNLHFAPRSCVPLIALLEIGQPFETQLETFMKGQRRSPDYLAFNSADKVPTFVADGQLLSQAAGGPAARFSVVAGGPGVRR